MMRGMDKMQQPAEMVQTLRRVAITMRDEHEGGDGWWAKLASLLFMAADHADGRGNTCGSCLGQAVAVAEAYEHPTPPASPSEQPNA